MRFDPKLPDDGVNISEQRPLRDVVLLVAGVSAVAIFGVLAIGFTLDGLVPYIPTTWEQRLFAGVGFADFEIGDGEDPREPEVQQIVDRLAAHWPDNPYDFDVGIMEDESLNAMALPGGRIVVTTALLEAAESETELALVLGHEIGHFEQRDHLRGMGRGVGIALFLAVFGLSEAGALVQSVTGVTARFFDRDQEHGADEFGLGLVWREYGHVSGATDFFRRLPDASADGGGRLARYASTHPMSADRIDALEAFARERGWALDRAAPPLLWPAVEGDN